MQQDKRNMLPNRGNQFPRSDTRQRDTLDLREFWKTLVRQKRLIAITVGVTLLLTLLFTLVSKNVYRATATLQIERETARVVDSDFLSSGDIRDTRDFYQTQFELIRSRTLAAKVIEELKLNETLENTSLFGHIKQWFGDDDPRSKQTALENKLLDKLSVEPVKNSRLVAVHYESSDPEQAAQIANAVVSTFQRMNTERRVDTTTDAQEYLSQSIKEAKTRAEEAEKRMTQYAQEHGIFQLDGQDATTASLTLQKLSEELVQAQKQRFEIESKYAVLSDKGRALADRIGILEDGTAYLQTLGMQLEKLKAQEQQQPSASLRKEISNVETKIEVAVKTKLTSLKGEVETAKNKENLTREGIARAKSAAMLEQDKTIAYNTLKQEATTNQELYQNLMQRLKEVGVAGGVAANNVAIIDKAQVPIDKFKPSLPTNLTFGALLGLLLGVSAAFLRDFMDDRVKDIAELERATQLPVLGIVPAVQDQTPEQLATLTIREPRSGVAEAFRSLRTAMRFILNDDNKGIIFVTSAHAGEGKSTTTANLACAYANAGNRVLLIDADLRNPSLHKTLGGSNEVGLANYLGGYGDTTTLVQATNVTNLSLIPAGTLPDDPAELLASAQMEGLLATAHDNFDLIILDGPPVLGLADAIILASLADTTLLTVRAESTQMGTLSNALKRLRQSHANLSGILLNQVDMRRGGRFGYDYADYYYYQPSK
ncbi:MAG: polysaccharide biosynthesis tyrosine autokinase [Gammaproteobacteria bacterium]|nr:polysaccharide biosynthesis tyrosine autokinase [Gammaproteobacteria bacterium]MBU1722901.1 polysaccharide biosynthesis tyrosine autokinase [Gammaproteobacteria bacterium]MBU2005722.1 polysaccharide biosynthesis tyrosine autokinase [Gammaproteobacteria bacterium]